SGSGDMAKSTYDTNSNGIIDNSEKLNGQAASFYQNATNLNAGTVNSALLPIATGSLPGVIKATSPYIAVDGSTGAITGLIADSPARFSATLTGDVTGAKGTPAVQKVGGKPAAQISTGVDDTIAATSANTASTIVKRDGSGNFTAGVVGASQIK